MKFQLFSTLALCVAATFAAPAIAHDVVYVAQLSGLAESPPNGSAGTGKSWVTVDDHDFTIRVQASFSGLSGNVGAGHIHCCTALAGSGTAGVATPVPSFPGFPSGVTSGSYDMTFDMTQTGSWNPGFIAANGGTTSNAFSALATGLQDGKAYLNIHTDLFPGGEIRGFYALAPVPEPETYALMLGGLGLLGWATRRRRPAA